MKKLTFIALLFLLISAAANAQYIVTKVNGRVKNGAGQYIRPGTQLKADEHVTWSTMNDKLWVIVIGKGEQVLSPQPGSQHGSGPFEELLLSSLHLDSHSGSLSGRGEIIEKIPDALHADSKSTGKIIIEEVNKFLFDPQQYPQADGSVFFIEIDVPQQAPIIRRLKTNADTLYISSAELATETMSPDIKYTLGYHSAGKSGLVAVFKPYFDITNEMESTIAVSIKAYKTGGLSKEAVRDSIYLNIYSTTGKPNGILFMEIFNNLWGSNGMEQHTRPVDGATGETFNQAEFNKVDVLSASIGISRDELPDNFSLRQYAPPVGYQGSFGSCTAWSTSYAARTISYAIAHGYSVNNQYDMIKSNTFATDFIYNNIKTNADCTNGTSIAKALNFMKTQGDIRRTSDLFQCGKTYDEQDLTTAKIYRIKDYIRVNDQTPDNKILVEKIKSLLVSKHPIPFGMNLPEDFRDVDKTGIWYPTDADRTMAQNVKHNGAAYVGHAMCVIGYNDSINNGSFEVMNSWGSWAANNGFYWINYDDFCDFAMDVFSINDFDPGAAAPTPPPANVTTPVKIVPVTVAVKQETPVKVIPRPVPKLKGDLEFTLLKDGADPEVIPVNKTTISTRGQVVDNDVNQSAGSYANFILSQPFYSGSKYKIKFNLSQSAYVYVIGMDKNSNYNLFPQAKLNESAFVSFNDATLYLPNQTQHYTLDNVTGKEKMCILISKSPIDIDALNDKFANDHNFYEDVRAYLNGRLLEITSANFSNSRIDFDTPVKDSDVLAFFVEINHL